MKQGPTNQVRLDLNGTYLSTLCRFLCKSLPAIALEQTLYGAASRALQAIEALGAESADH
jgi:hypothetical protein